MTIPNMHRTFTAGATRRAYALATMRALAAPAPAGRVFSASNIAKALFWTFGAPLILICGAAFAGSIVLWTLALAG